MGVVITVVLLLRQSIEIAFLTIDFRVRPLLSLRAGLWVWFFALRHSRLAHYRHWNPVFVVSLANVVQAFHPTQLGLSSKNLGLITQHVIFLSETMLSQYLRWLTCSPWAPDIPGGPFFPGLPWNKRYCTAKQQFSKCKRCLAVSFPFLFYFCSLQMNSITQNFSNMDYCLHVYKYETVLGEFSRVRSILDITRAAFGCSLLRPNES